MEKLIVAHRGDRLGGRLNTLVNAMRIADRTGLSFRYHWGTIEHRDYEINNYVDLFTDDFLRENLEKRCFRSLRQTLFRLPQWPRFPIDALVSRCEDSRGWLVSGTRAHVFQGESAEDVRRELWECFHRIGFRPELIEEIAGISRLMRGQEAIALHIRRGDVLWPNFRWVALNKYRPTVLHAEFIRRRQASGGNEKFIVFSDDAETVSDLKREFPSVRSKEDFLETSKYTEIQIALFDIVLMMNCKQIVGPGGSVFSNFAETLSGANFLPIAEAFEEEELRELLFESLSHRQRELHDANERQRIDFVMDVLAVFALVPREADMERWLPLVAAARTCDPDNCALEHLLARIEWARGDKVTATFHYRKAAVCSQLLPVAGRIPQKYAVDAAKAAIELSHSELPLQFPLHPKRGKLMDDATNMLEAAAGLGASDGRMEAALAEVWVVQGGVRRLSGLLGAPSTLGTPEEKEGFCHLFGRLLLGGESLRHQARQQLKVAARQEETADLAAALLYRLHRQDRDETGMRRMLRRRPSAREAYPWLFADLDEAESDESSIPGGFNEEEAARESAAEE